MLLLMSANIGRLSPPTSLPMIDSHVYEVFKNNPSIKEGITGYLKEKLRTAQLQNFILGKHSSSCILQAN